MFEKHIYNVRTYELGHCKEDNYVLNECNQSSAIEINYLILLLRPGLKASPAWPGPAQSLKQDPARIRVRFVMIRNRVSVRISSDL